MVYSAEENQLFLPQQPSVASRFSSMGGAPWVPTSTMLGFWLPCADIENWWECICAIALIALPRPENTIFQQRSSTFASFHLATFSSSMMIPQCLCVHVCEYVCVWYRCPTYSWTPEDIKMANIDVVLLICCMVPRAFPMLMWILAERESVSTFLWNPCDYRICVPTGLSLSILPVLPLSFVSLTS